MKVLKKDRLSILEDERRKYIFYGTLIISFILIWVYNYLTPLMSDDLIYVQSIEDVESLMDIIKLTYSDYMNYNGRFFLHLILRILLTLPNWAFKLLNSAMYVALTLLMYLNVDSRRKYDVRLITIITMLMWYQAVYFDQTILWQTGSINYLWGTTIILGVVTLYRYYIKINQGNSIYITVLMYFVGICAGWCNENTSGGGIILTLLFGYVAVRVRKIMKIRLWMISTVLGQITGLILLVISPGAKLRAGLFQENHSGFAGYMARWLKINLAIRDELFITLALFVVVAIILYYQKMKYRGRENMWIYAFASLATAYAIVLSPTPVSRVYFGTGIFLMIAVAQGITYVEEKDWLVPTLKTGMVAIAVAFFFFMYLENGAHLMRINREVRERERYMIAKVIDGEEHIVVPMLRPEFKNKYSMAYTSDVVEDFEHGYINVCYCEYYGLGTITGMPREEFEASGIAPDYGTY